MHIYFAAGGDFLKPIQEALPASFITKLHLHASTAKMASVLALDYYA